MTKTEKIKRVIAQDPTLGNRVVADVVGCTRRMVRHVRQEMGPTVKNMPKILIFDIETAPMEIYTWGLGKQHPTIGQVIKDWSLLTWSAKWLFESEVYSSRVSTEEAIDRDDSSIIAGLWNLMDEADILIGHNAQGFDVKKSNLRFMLNGLLPPSPYRVIDTLTHSRKIFNSSSFKLDYLNKIFGNETKIKTEFELWKRCVTGDGSALEEMEIYNRGDVVITEELYLTLRPWMKGHPNIGLYINTDETVCTNCGNENLIWGGHYYTPAGKYKSFRCNNCGAIGRSRLSDLDKETRARLLLSIAA